MFELLFWVSAAVLAYTYVGFPALLLIRAKVRPHIYVVADCTPKVSLIVTAHNEVGVIRQKLENILSLDYPKDRLEVIVASDGSDDGTNEIVAHFRERGVRLLALPRRGKIPTLNHAVLQARHEILVLSDANSMYSPDALRALVRPFADASVGGVAGDQRYVKGDAASSAVAGECAYWNIDRALKEWQSESGSVTSATGAIYAIRRTLFRPLPCGVCDDATASYRVITGGYRMVFAPNATAYERVAPSAEAEFRRKVRVCTRGLRGLIEDAQILNPFRFGFYAVQVLSHKLLRWLAVWPLVILFLASLRLGPQGGIFAALAMAQSVFYGLAAVVFLLRRTKGLSGRRLRPLTVPFYFCLANVAFLTSQFQVIRGKRIDSWQVRRAEGEHSATLAKHESAIV